jgi:hypothetical protein
MHGLPCAWPASMQSAQHHVKVQQDATMASCRHARRPITTVTV